MNSPQALRFQFDLATLFWLMGAVGVLLFAWRWSVYFPYWIALPTVFFVLSWIVAKRNRSPDLAWGLFAIGWCLTNSAIAKGLRSIFMVSSGLSLTDMEDDILRLAYGSAVVLPLYLSIPIVTLAWKASRGNRASARKWLILCPVIGLLDVTALTVSIVILLRLSWPWL